MAVFHIILYYNVDLIALSEIHHKVIVLLWDKEILYTYKGYWLVLYRYNPFMRRGGL